jgi:hypothetical protein
MAILLGLQFSKERHSMTSHEKVSHEMSKEKTTPARDMKLLTNSHGARSERARFIRRFSRRCAYHGDVLERRMFQLGYSSTASPVHPTDVTHLKPSFSLP